MTETDVQKFQTMIDAKLRDHVVNEEHCTLPERPCQYFQDHRKIFFWTISGLSTAMLIGWGIVTTQTAGSTTAFQGLNLSVQEIKLRQAKTDADMDYIKLALNDIKSDLKAHRSGP